MLASGEDGVLPIHSCALPHHRRSSYDGEQREGHPLVHGAMGRVCVFGASLGPPYGWKGPFIFTEMKENTPFSPGLDSGAASTGQLPLKA